MVFYPQVSLLTPAKAQDLQSTERSVGPKRHRSSERDVGPERGVALASVEYRFTYFDNI